MPSSKKENSSSSFNIKQGEKYERLAGDFYVQEGFDVLEFNWRAGKKEIDLIVQKENLIVFVEVKSSNSQKFGHPSERVDKKKIQNLSDAANQFIIDHNIQNCDLRFDVVTFVDGQMEYYPNAFEGMG